MYSHIFVILALFAAFILHAQARRKQNLFALFQFLFSTSDTSFDRFSDVGKFPLALGCKEDPKQPSDDQITVFLRVT